MRLIILRIVIIYVFKQSWNAKVISFSVKLPVTSSQTILAKEIKRTCYQIKQITQFVLIRSQTHEANNTHITVQTMGSTDQSVEWRVFGGYILLIEQACVFRLEIRIC